MQTRTNRLKVTGVSSGFIIAIRSARLRFPHDSQSAVRVQNARQKRISLFQSGVFQQNRFRSFLLNGLAHFDALRVVRAVKEQRRRAENWDFPKL